MWANDFKYYDFKCCDTCKYLELNHTYCHPCTCKLDKKKVRYDTDESDTKVCRRWRPAESIPVKKAK